LVFLFLLFCCSVDCHFDGNCTALNFTAVHFLHGLPLRCLICKSNKAEPTSFPSFSAFSKFSNHESRNLTGNNVSGRRIVTGKKLLQLNRISNVTSSIYLVIRVFKWDVGNIDCGCAGCAILRRSFTKRLPDSPLGVTTCFCFLRTRRLFSRLLGETPTSGLSRLLSIAIGGICGFLLFLRNTFSSPTRRRLQKVS
jgi:hypothetical protein